MTLFFQAVTTDGKTEIFNANKILTATPRDNGTVKILMGAGLYWTVYADSITPLHSPEELLTALRGGTE